MRRHSSLLIGLATALILATAADANSTRVTRGDAQAVFESLEGAGWAIRFSNGRLEGAPAQFFPEDLVRIAPLVAFFDGQHYCALDWHVIHLALIWGNEPGFPHLTNSEIRDTLADWSLEFVLDGATIQTESTVPKRMMHPEIFGEHLVGEEAYFVSHGRIVAPEDLSVGPHTLLVHSVPPSSAELPPGDLGPITFHIDAPGTGVCGPDDALTFREVK